MSATGGEPKIIKIGESAINIHPQNSSYDSKTNTITITYGPNEPNINRNVSEKKNIEENLTGQQKDFVESFTAEIAAEKERKAKGGRKRRKSKRRKSRRRKSKRRSYRRR